MSLIRNIKIGISADLSKFSSGIREAIGDLDRLSEASVRTQDVVGSLGETRGSRGNASAGSAKPAADAMGPLLSTLPRLEAAMTNALAPLTQIGATLGQQFNRLGGVIVEASRRMSDAMRVIGGKAVKDTFANASPNPEKGGVAVNARSFRNAIGTGTQEATTIRNIARSVEGTQQLARAATAAGDAFGRGNATVARQANLVERMGTTAVGWSKRLRVDPKFASFLSNRDVGAAAPLEKLSKLNLGGTTAQAKGLSRALPTVASAANAATTSAKRFGLEIALALGFVGLAYKATSAVVGFFRAGISGAADLGETLSKARAILGDAAPAVESFADRVSAEFGLVKRDVLDAGSSFAGLGKGLGNLKGKQLSDFSVRFTQLSADLQSFANTGSLAEASQALTIGLSGEQSDVLKRLGVILNDTTVKQYALANGISSGKGPLTEQQKLAARAGIIQEKLADANGDLARTFGSTKNAGRALSGTITNLGVSIGQALEPAIAAGVGLLNQFATVGMKAFNDYKPAFAAFAGGVSEAFGVVGAVFRNYDLVLAISGLKGREMFANLLAAMAVVPENVSTIGSYLRDNWYRLLTDLVNSTKTMSDNIDKNMLGLFESIQGFLKGDGWNFEWTPLLEGFKATVDRFPELAKPAWVSMDADIARIGDEWTKREAALAGKPGKEAGKSPLLKVDGGAGLGAAGDGEKYHGTAVARLGSAEAGSTLARFRNQSGGDDPAKQTAAAARTQVELQKSMAESLTYLKNAQTSGNGVSLAIAKL